MRPDSSLHPVTRVCCAGPVPSELSPRAREMLTQANFGHLATLMPGGEPKVDPVWVGLDGTRILVATDAKSLKARNVDADARVALSVTAFDDPYEQLLVRGVVAEVRPDDDLAVLDEMSLRYLGTPFPRRRWSSRVVLVVDPVVVRHYSSPLRDPRLADGG
ncbi:MAG: TIGR03618 family F420-dependent PPOX class oxidoreductase [Actinobacteria bacterium]|nr:TIGR03618 family F420-dependent PPOX class oxidoreductase [Actinomycetota bacterium]